MWAAGENRKRARTYLPVKLLIWKYLGSFADVAADMLEDWINQLPCAYISIAGTILYIVRLSVIVLPHMVPCTMPTYDATGPIDGYVHLECDVCLMSQLQIELLSPWFHLNEIAIPCVLRNLKDSFTLTWKGEKIMMCISLSIKRIEKW